LVAVTVVPTATRNVCGANAKFWMVIVGGCVVRGWVVVAGVAGGWVGAAARVGAAVVTAAALAAVVATAAIVLVVVSAGAALVVEGSSLVVGDARAANPV
jgi:hypothetical protein